MISGSGSCDAGPIGEIAPGWVNFTDVPMWVEHRFGIKLSPHAMQDLFSVIRRDTSDDPFRIPSPSTVRHRLKDLTFANVRIRGRVIGHGIVDPRGLRLLPSGRIAVASWDLAEFDGTTFTVAGPWDRSTGRRSRHGIEVYWIDVERWASNRLDSFGSGSVNLKAEFQAPSSGTVHNEPADQPASASPKKDLPPFNAVKAKKLLLSAKRDLKWTSPPNEEIIKAYLRRYFSGAPNDSYRKVCHEVWPGLIKRGRRKTIRTAE